MWGCVQLRDSIASSLLFQLNGPEGFHQGECRSQPVPPQVCMMHIVYAESPAAVSLSNVTTKQSQPLKLLVHLHKSCLLLLCMMRSASFTDTTCRRFSGKVVRWCFRTDHAELSSRCNPLEVQGLAVQKWSMAPIDSNVCPRACNPKLDS